MKMIQNKNHTFVVLAYKESLYIEDCINSLLNQSIKSKIIISTSTPSLFLDKISQKYNLPLIVNKNSKSIASDWNFAYNLAQTQWVTLAHQDDIYEKNYTKLFLNKANKDTLILFSDYDEIINNKIRKMNFNLLIKKIILFLFFGLNKSLSNNFLKRMSVSFGSAFACPSVTYNKNLLKNFSFNDNFNINMDWNAWLELSKQKGSFFYINHKLLQHRIHNNSETSKGIKNNQRFIEDYIVLKKIWPALFAKIIVRIYSLSYKSN